MEKPFHTKQNILYSTLVGAAGLIYAIFYATSGHLALQLDGSRLHAGYYVAWYAAGAFCGHIVWGWLADTLGKARVVAISLLIVAVGLLTAFLSAHKPVTIAAILLIGGGVSAVEAMSSALLADNHPAAASRWIHLSQVCFCIGALGAPMLVVWAAPSGSLQLYCLLAIALIPLAALSCLQRSGKVPPTAQRWGRNPFQLLQQPPFLAVCGMIFLYCGCESLVVTYLQQYSQYAGCSEAAAAFAMSLFWLFMILARLAGAIRVGNAVSGIRSSSLVLLAGLLILCLFAGPILHFLGAALIGLGCGPLWCRLFVLGESRCAAGRSGAAFAIMSLFSACANTLFPILFGSWVKQLRITFLLCILLVTGLLFFLRRFERLATQTAA